MYHRQMHFVTSTLLTLAFSYDRYVAGLTWDEPGRLLLCRTLVTSVQGISEEYSVFDRNKGMSLWKLRQDSAKVKNSVHWAKGNRLILIVDSGDAQAVSQVVLNSKTKRRIATIRNGKLEQSSVSPSGNHLVLITKRTDSPELSIVDLISKGRLLFTGPLSGHTSTGSRITWEMSGEAFWIQNGPSHFQRFSLSSPGKPISVNIKVNPEDYVGGRADSLLFTSKDGLFSVSSKGIVTRVSKIGGHSITKLKSGLIGLLCETSDGLTGGAYLVNENEAPNLNFRLVKAFPFNVAAFSSDGKMLALVKGTVQVQFVALNP